MKVKAYGVNSPTDDLKLMEINRRKLNPSDVLVEITYCGVCHSDIHLTDGFFDIGNGKRITLADRGTKLPFTPGHEITGEVLSIGENVKDISVGDKGIVFPWIGCQGCNACKENNETLKPQM